MSSTPVSVLSRPSSVSRVAMRWRSAATRTSSDIEWASFTQAPHTGKHGWQHRTPDHPEDLRAAAAAADRVLLRGLSRPGQRQLRGADDECRPWAVGDAVRIWRRAVLRDLFRVRGAVESDAGPV